MYAFEEKSFESKRYFHLNGSPNGAFRSCRVCEIGLVSISMKKLNEILYRNIYNGSKKSCFLQLKFEFVFNFL